MTEVPKMTDEQRLAFLLQKKDGLIKQKALVKARHDRNVEIQRDYEQRNKLLYFGHEDKGYLGEHGTWEPNIAQKTVIKKFRDPSYLIYGLTGANQIGKTTLEICCIAALMKGYFPWEDPNLVGRYIWEQRGWKPPIEIRWIGGGWEEHIKKNLVEQGIVDNIPESWNWKSKKNSIGVDAMWTDPETGSKLNLMSNKQDRKVFAGWKGHAVFYDEPFPMEIWGENLMRIMAKNGLIFIGASLVEADQSWIEEMLSDDLVLEDRKLKVFNYNADVYVNVGHGLNQKSIDILDLLPPEEREVRKFGVSAGAQKKILKLKDVHFIRDKNISHIPPDFLTDISIDYHPNKPQYIHMLSTGPYNKKYLSHEMISDYGKAAGYQWIGKSIIDAENKYNLRINRIIIDPLSKGNKNALEQDQETVFSKLSDYLAGFGHELETASKHKEDGIIGINTLLEPQMGDPGLYILQDGCPVASRQLKKWKRDEKGLPVKTDDDGPENTYRLVNLETEYTTPDDDEESEGYYEDDKSSLGACSDTGY